MHVPSHLMNKYNVPTPRYTSYPTVPYWNESIDTEKWQQLFIKRMKECNQDGGISIYIHLPFCEKLCTFCGCNKKITTNHGVENEYIVHLLKEWKIYRSLMQEPPIISELHIGGGTPTFFSPANLHYLLNTIFSDCIIPKKHEFSFEGHPNNTTKEHLQVLFNLGFNRVSFGVQDSNLKVQEAINRIQPQENVNQVVRWAREIGYNSVNLDLVYGLPLQDADFMKKTIEDTLKLRPDRISFYSYAHVPWTSKAQRLFDENDLPDPATKMQLYQMGTRMFTENGYTDIGMDHFALSTDEMVKARDNGGLHRNFMGYTVQKTGMLLGLGVSSISDIYYGFAQNKKTIHEYYDEVANNNLAITKGYFLNNEDQAMRQYILNIACLGKTNFQASDLPILEKYSFPVLSELTKDGLVEWNTSSLTITPLGAHFIRNICKAFDIKLLSAEDQGKQFSKAI